MSYKKRNLTETSGQAPEKKLKTGKGKTQDMATHRVTSDPNLLATVFSFLDAPSLGNCARVCKSFQAGTGKDEAWERNLVDLLESKFDRRYECCFHKFSGNVVPISKRPLKSSNFLAWHREICAAKNMDPWMSVEGPDGNLLPWLVQDVPLQSYYKEAVRFASTEKPNLFGPWLGFLVTPQCCHDRRFPPTLLEFLQDFSS